MTRTWPVSGLRSPQMVSTSVRWPFPATPTRPRISPWRKVRLTSFSGSSFRPLTRKTVWRGSSGSRATWRITSRPTINWASSSLVCIPSAAMSATICPLRSTAISSDRAMTSPSLWLMKTMALPWRAMRRNASNSCSASWGVSTAVGSSKIKTRLRRKSSLRISTRCFSPMERPETRAPGSISSLTSRARSDTCRSISWEWRSSPPGWPRKIFSATVMASTSMKC